MVNLQELGAKIQNIGNYLLDQNRNFTDCVNSLNQQGDQRKDPELYALANELQKLRDQDTELGVAVTTLGAKVASKGP
jgi:hypothetical protein